MGKESTDLLPRVVVLALSLLVPAVVREWWSGLLGQRNLLRRGGGRLLRGRLARGRIRSRGRNSIGLGLLPLDLELLEALGDHRHLLDIADGRGSALDLLVGGLEAPPELLEGYEDIDLTIAILHLLAIDRPHHDLRLVQATDLADDRLELVEPTHELLRSIGRLHSLDHPHDVAERWLRTITIISLKLLDLFLEVHTPTPHLAILINEPDKEDGETDQYRDDEAEHGVGTVIEGVEPDVHHLHCLGGGDGVWNLCRHRMPPQDAGPPQDHVDEPREHSEEDGGDERPAAKKFTIVLHDHSPLSIKKPCAPLRFEKRSNLAKANSFLERNNEVRYVKNDHFSLHKAFLELI